MKRLLAFIFMTVAVTPVLLHAQKLAPGDAALQQNENSGTWVVFSVSPKSTGTLNITVFDRDGQEVAGEKWTINVMSYMPLHVNMKNVKKSGTYTAVLDGVGIENKKFEFTYTHKEDTER